MWQKETGTILDGEVMDTLQRKQLSWDLTLALLNNADESVL